MTSPHLLRIFSTSTGLAARFRTGVLWNTVAALSLQGTVFVTNLILANLLGQEGFGGFSIIYTTLMAAAGIAQVATGITATKYVAEFRDSKKSKAGRVLGLCAIVSFGGGLLATLALGLSAPWLAGHILKAPELGGALAIGGGFLLFTGMNGYQQGALAGFEAYRPLAWISIAHGVVHVLGIAFATFLWGLLGAAVGLTVSALARWWLFHVALRKEARRWDIPVSFQNAFTERAVFRQFALPAAIAGFVSMVALWLANALLVQQTGGLVQMGLYAAASSLKNMVLFFPALTNSVGTTLLNYQRGMGDQHRYRKVFWANLAATAVSLLVAAGCLAALGKILLALFGAAFVQAYPVLLVLLVAAVLEGIAIATYQIVQSQEQMWLSLALVSLPRDVAIVALAYLFVPSQGAIGLATAHLLSWALALTALLIIIKRIRISVHSWRPSASLPTSKGDL